MMGNGEGLFYLYKYTHRENGKGYIGVTCRLANRQKAHAKGESGALAFNRAVNKYGIDAFDYKILAVLDDVNTSNFYENATIKLFGTLSPKGYNLIGGQPYSIYRGPLSHESCIKISAALKGRPSWQKGKPSRMKGKRRSPETCLRISEGQKGRLCSMKGKHRSPETCLRISEGQKGRPSGMKGKHHSVETRIIMSIARKGKLHTLKHCEAISRARRGQKLTPFSPERLANHLRTFSDPLLREKISNSLRGRNLPPEHRAAISRGNKGKIKSSEHRKNLSLSLKKYFLEKRKS